MTPQEERNRRFDELVEDYGIKFTTHFMYVEPIEILEHFLTSEVNLTIEQVEKWARENKYEPGFSCEVINYEDLLSFLTTLKK